MSHASKDKRKGISSPRTSPPARSRQDGQPKKPSPPPQQGTASFVFVEGQRQRQDRGTRTLIRTHVMRNFLQQTEEKPVPGIEEHIPPRERVVIGQRQKFKLTTKNLEPVKSSRSRPKPNAARAQPKPRRPGEGAFQISLAKSTHEEPIETAEVLAGAPDDFSWLEALEDDVDFAFESVEEFPEATATRKLHPVFPQLQPWEEQIQGLSNGVPFTSPIDIEGLTQSRLDPFDALPVLLNHSTEVLIDRFQSTFVASWCPISPQSGWFAFAITDPALFHGTLYHWAAHKANAGNGIDRDSPEILAHKLETMRLVNERLGDPEQELKDETIAAVACLANVETSFGSLEASQIHMTGLEKMITLRGGVNQLGFNGLLARLIHWVDAGNATLYSHPVRFPAFQPARVTVTTDGFTPTHMTCHSPAPSTSFLHTAPESPTTEQWDPFISRDVLLIFDEIRRLSDLLDTMPRTAMQETERMNLSDSFSMIERKSLSYSLVPASSRNHRAQFPDTPAQDLISECCSLAALIYVHLTLRGVLPQSIIISQLAVNLKAKLSLFRDLIAAWHVAPRILTWILVTGAVASKDREERSWFVPQLADVCEMYGLRYWEDLKEWLRSFLFLESGNEEKIRGVWDEVEGFMGVLERLGVGKGDDVSGLVRDWEQDSSELGVEWEVN